MSEGPAYSLDDFKKKQSQKYVSGAYQETTFAAILAVLIALSQFGLRYSMDLMSVGTVITLILYLGLSAGVYFKSRVSAVVLFVFFVSNITLYNVLANETKIGRLSFLFGAGFFYAIVATFRYHSGKKYLAKSEEPTEGSLYEKIMSGSSTLPESEDKVKSSKYNIYTDSE